MSTVEVARFKVRKGNKSQKSQLQEAAETKVVIFAPTRQPMNHQDLVAHYRNKFNGDNVMTWVTKEVSGGLTRRIAIACVFNMQTQVVQAAWTIERLVSAEHLAWQRWQSTNQEKETVDEVTNQPMDRWAYFMKYVWQTMSSDEKRHWKLEAEYELKQDPLLKSEEDLTIRDLKKRANNYAWMDFINRPENKGRETYPHPTNSSKTLNQKEYFQHVWKTMPADERFKYETAALQNALNAIETSAHNQDNFLKESATNRLIKQTQNGQIHHRVTFQVPLKTSQYESPYGSNNFFLKVPLNEETMQKYRDLNWEEVLRRSVRYVMPAADQYQLNDQSSQ